MSRLALLDELRATLDRTTRENRALREAASFALCWLEQAKQINKWSDRDLLSISADKLRAALALSTPPDDHPVPWSGSPGYSGEKCGPVSDADPLPWEAGPPNAAHAAADAAMFLDDGDFEG